MRRADLNRSTFTMPGQVDVSLKSRLEMCFKVLKEYSWLLDSYVLDFFTENHMETLPKSWREHIRSIPLNEFEYILNLSLNKSNTIWPLSILCLKALVQYLSLVRSIKDEEYKTSVRFLQSNNINIRHNNMHLLNKNRPVFFEHPKLQNLFLKHVKPKKRYEIFKMAKTMAEIANKLDVKYVVDVGSGLGHLSRIMAYGFDMKVCSVETQPQFTEQAKKLDSELETTASKYLSQEDLKILKTKRPVYINKTIKFNLTPDEFIKNLKSAFSVNHTNFEFGIIGLHPCGDLASILLKFYTECSEAKFINLVGCCYHKLSTASDSENDLGFPLTKFCAAKSINISYEARALACHAIETYCSRLKSTNYCHLKVHCYRATLEKIIAQNWPQFRKSALGNVKSDPKLNFVGYCEMALKKLNLSMPKEVIESHETAQMISSWEDVVKFYSLRLMLAPLVETIILLDRKLYLLEKEIHCSIIAAFDPEISPRNQLLLSDKSKLL